MSHLNLDTIYFHTDYDGVVSAAMLVRLNQSSARLKGVDYDMKPGWADLQLERRAAVVDFLYHPDAEVWFDHHAMPFVLPAWQSMFHEDACHAWVPGALACPPIIGNKLDFPSDVRRHFADYIHWSEIIDGARYHSPSEAHDLSNPHFLLSRIVSLAREPAVLEHIVNVVAREEASTAVADSQISQLASSVRNLETRLRRRLAPHIAFDGQVAMLDQSDEPGPYQRYLPYLYYPDAGFVVGIYRKGGAWNVSVGANPWRKTTAVHIGHLCQKWGGGGHPKVGGVTVTRHDEAIRIASAIRDEIETA